MVPAEDVEFENSGVGPLLAVGRENVGEEEGGDTPVQGCGLEGKTDAGPGARESLRAVAAPLGGGTPGDCP